MDTSNDGLRAGSPCARASWRLGITPSRTRARAPATLESTPQLPPRNSEVGASAVPRRPLAPAGLHQRPDGQGRRQARPLPHPPGDRGRPARGGARHRRRAAAGTLDDFLRLDAVRTEDHGASPRRRHRQRALQRGSGSSPYTSIAAYFAVWAICQPERTRADDGAPLVLLSAPGLCLRTRPVRAALTPGRRPPSLRARPSLDGCPAQPTGRGSYGGCVRRGAARPRCW